MATASIALGQLAECVFALESGSYGTPAATGYRKAFYYSTSLAQSKPLEGDPVIGASLNNFRDATTPAPTMSEHGGNLVVPVCLNQIGDWLKMILGAPATSGATNFTHAFTTGKLTLPTYTVELNPIAGDFRQHVGVAARSLRLNFQDANGYQRAEIGLLGYGENLLGATGAGTPTAARAYAPIKATGAAVFLAGTQIGVLMGLDFNYETGLIQDRYVDGNDTFGAAVLAEQAQISGTLRLRYTGPTFDAAAIAETDQSLEIRMITGVNNSLFLTMPAVRLGRGGVPINGPGGIEQSIPFRAAQTAGAPMMTATLKNQIASY